MNAVQNAAVNNLKSLVPREALGWKTQAKDEVYDPETIFDYIDGAGEVYRSYNFRLLLSRRFEKAGESEIIVDLFDMGSSADAFGVFTHDLDGEDASLGQGSNYKGGLLSFWKDRYFVSIFAEKETAETKEALFALGRPIASAIGREGPRPSLLTLLPEWFRDEKSVHYFHNHLILNYHFFVSQENILNLGQTTEAVLAKSGPKGQDGVLLLVRYPEANKAADAFNNFVKDYMPDAKIPGLVQTEDKKWTAAGQQGSFALIVFGAGSKSDSKEWIRAAEEGVGNLGNGKKP